MAKKKTDEVVEEVQPTESKNENKNSNIYNFFILCFF